jgi:hypothetical protein
MSALIVIITPALIVIYDLLAYHLAGMDATITAVIHRWQIKYPELPALVGGLFAWLWLHLFLSGLIRAMGHHAP